MDTVSDVRWALREADLEMEKRVQEAHWGVFSGSTPTGEGKGASTTDEIGQ